MVAAQPESLWDVVGAVEDPEMPPLTLADLGILRRVAVDDGVVTVTITPTYSGCPAVEAIESAIAVALAEAGHSDVLVERTLVPAWTTDWITDEAKAKLAEIGIAPPRPVAVAIGPAACPLCGSTNTEQISRFGATACKALHRCRACREPFDRFKEL